MRPHRLVMENFGPYREPAVIDFDALGPVFLVWGKTGSGKTSIFDAMTYALYGGVAGSRSGLERQLWSQHAKPGDKPRVEFEFDLGGETWKVERIAPHRKTIRNGEERDAPAEAICWRLDGGQWTPVADRIGEVDAEMESRLGLSLDEFSKIVLLPQGEFQRFLEMDSSDRVGILEKLFPVDLHDAVTELARQKARAAAEELKRVEAELGRLRGEAAAAGLAMDGEVEDHVFTLYQPQPGFTIAITNIACCASNDTVLIQWNGQTPTVFDPQFAEALTTNTAWTSCGSYVIAPPYEHGETMVTQRFYRVRAPFTFP